MSYIYLQIKVNETTILDFILFIYIFLCIPKIFWLYYCSFSHLLLIFSTIYIKQLQ